MDFSEHAEPYERPTIEERIPVGDPLIIGYMLSPKWRHDDEPDGEG